MRVVGGLNDGKTFVRQSSSAGKKSLGEDCDKVKGKKQKK